MGYAIVTRYVGPTNYRGSRIIGTGPAPHLPAWDAPAGTRMAPTRATVSWDYGAGNGPAPSMTRPDGSCNVSACPGSPSHDVLAHREQDAQADYDGRYAGWGDSDANHRRAADAVVGKLRAAGWTVFLAPDDRGATLPDESGRVFVLRYRTDAEGGADDAESIVAHALTGPTSGADARRLAPGTLANLTRAGYRITSL